MLPIAVYKVIYSVSVSCFEVLYIIQHRKFIAARAAIKRATHCSLAEQQVRAMYLGTRDQHQLVAAALAFQVTEFLLIFILLQS